ncbi:hypothetical protein [Escherichia fergusonii]|uniref:hypothetical protein n=1 Tax=Escherichia fergusonii TaxID=564 RepID=UPI0006146CB3|nr:hypothetical protein [Escherichia fergusonii]KWW08290.1 hypothetical protein VL22_0201500 [Escherichia fergusonii]
MTDRKRFEAWCCKNLRKCNLLKIGGSNGEYISPTMQARWEIWKAASQEMRRVASAFKTGEAVSAKAAIDTLDRMGFTWEGGVYWKPPVGLIPSYLIQQLNAEHNPS